jgi:hypothetical protein
MKACSALFACLLLPMSAWAFQVRAFSDTQCATDNGMGTRSFVILNDAAAPPAPIPRAKSIMMKLSDVETRLSVYARPETDSDYRLTSD